MQTFLPYQDFSKSAASLDDKRLNNQINEALIILRTLTGWYSKNRGKGWPNHPCTKMWAGYEAALCEYGMVLLEEYNYRMETDCTIRAWKMAEALGQNDTQYANWRQRIIKYPEWLTEEFCARHRQILLEKDFEFYSKKFNKSL